MLTEPQAIQRAIAAIERREWAEAERLCRAVLDANANNFDALSLWGLIAIQTGKMQFAAQVLSRAVSINPNNAGIQYNRGLALAALHRHDEALASYDRAISLKPDFLDAYNNRGNTLQELKRNEEALASYDRALALRPDAEVFYNRGNVLRSLQRNIDAVSDYEHALALNPNYVVAHLNRGNALRELGRDSDALASFERAISLAPDFAEPHNNRGNALRDLRQPAKAVESYERAIALKTDFAEAYGNLGNALHDIGQDTEALAAYDRALVLKPDAGVYINRGNTLRDCKRLAQALASYEHALQLDPDRDFLYGIWLHTKMKICDWSDIENQFDRLIAKIDRGERASLPFSMLAIADSPTIQRKAAEIWVKYKHPMAQPVDLIPKRPAHDKIRIGYFSADFHQHATAQLMAELFEHHDKSRFHLSAVSFGPETNDAMRARVSAAFDEFVDVRGLSDHEVTTLARNRQIDIAVDLKGFTQGNRVGIFAQRAAPIQVSYLGYPGTMGANFIDYLVADWTLVPEESQQFYAEKIIYLPNSFQVNDRQRGIADRVFNREEVGLPAYGFVFCCFNSNYKITPDIFDCWMKILGRVEDSVLWLLRDDVLAETNLKREAARRGIDADRIVFAPHLPLSEHLARHRLANLFLDTLPCNAHTTASDALWAGLPVLTCAGGTFAGRVAASLLNAIGLPSLVVDTPEAYIELATALARNPDQLARIRQSLADNRLTTALFNSQLSTIHIEAAYEAIYARYQGDRSPEHIYVQG